MARPVNKGLHYFPMDVGFFDDERIMMLMDRFGPVGNTVYSALLTAIYKEGYFLKFSSMDMLALRIIRLIGSKWVPEAELFVKILGFCGELGLFDRELLEQGVITSAAIQRRYKQVTARLKASHAEYWLLDEDEPADEPSDESKEPVSQSNADSCDRVSVTETAVSDAEMPLNKTKQNKTKENKRKRKETRGGCDDDTAPAPVYRNYGRFQNVRLTDEEYDALKTEVRNRDELIERVSVWMKGHGKQPVNCYARLLQWEQEDREKNAGEKNTPYFPGNTQSSYRPSPSYDIQAFAQGGFDLDRAIAALDEKIS